MVGNADELQEEYKTELLEFLKQKISHAGGSLQFQHLSGLLQQLRFEIKDALGVTKAALMKFLKTNPSTFKVDSKGVVTLVNTSLNNICPTEEENQKKIAKKNSVSKIENGEGRIFKLFPQFAIIKAIHPCRTYIFFTPLEFGAEKDSLFVDLDLEVGYQVGFNAVHGHVDYEIEYKATKVWRIYDSDDEDEDVQMCNVQTKPTKPNKFIGEGIIKKLLPNGGFISATGKENLNIFFQKKFFENNVKCGDKVKFVAEYISNEWQATEIISKKNNDKQPEQQQTYINKPSDHSQTSMKKTDKYISADCIRNEPGRIFPNSKGAIIKFGKNFSELADGSACYYYYHGIKLACQDVAMEFSEGDEVNFDAVKSEDSLGWKALLVWIGNKPATIPKIDKQFKENFDSKSENKADYDGFAPDHSTEISKLNKSKMVKNNKIVNIIGKESDLNKNKSKCGRPPKQNFFSTPENYQEDNIKNYQKDNTMASKMPQKFPHKDTKSKRDKKKYNKNSNDKYNQRVSFSKSKCDKVGKNNDNLLNSKDLDLDVSDSSEIASEENNELQDSSYFPRKFLKEDKEYLPAISDLKDETCSESEAIYGNVSAFAKGKGSIKIFEDIEGEISKVHCMVGYIKSDHPGVKEVDFVYNVFYRNRRSLEELRVSELTEAAEVGEVIKFNCFVIIDDNGEIYKKVTLAWIGPKPSVTETKPEDFISQQNLSVSCIDPNCEDKQEEIFDTSYFITPEEASGNSEADSSTNDKFEDASQEILMTSESILDNADEHRSSDVHSEKLPGVVLRKLETYGFLPSNSEDALNIAQEIIDLVRINSSIEDLPVKNNCDRKKDPANLCHSCGKSEKSCIEESTIDVEVQTIITGEIVATRTWIT